MTEERGVEEHGGVDPWALFEERLAAYFSTMQDPVDEDRIMFYVPRSDVPTVGRINVFTFAEGTCLQATMAGDYTTRPVSEAADLARAVREVIEMRFALPHPDLVTVTAYGPASTRVALLGLAPHGRVRPGDGDLPQSGVQSWGGPGPGSGADLAWARLELRLAAYLSTMTDPGEGDHLVLTTSGGQGDVAPYAQFAGFGGGQALRAELSGSAFVAPAYQLSVEKRASMRFLGWAGDDDAEPNLFIHWSVDDPHTLAGMVAWVLRDDFGVAHPDRLTVRAWGPAAASAGVLGLSATAEDPDAGIDPDDAHLFEASLFNDYTSPDGADFAGELEATEATSLVASGYEQLTSLLAAALKPRFGSPLLIDEDEDFMVTHNGQLVFLRVRREEPVVELMSQVVCDVRSRRPTALELSVINRDHDWVKWALRRRVVEQTLLIPAYPFSATLVDEMVRLFLNALDATRDDLVLRLGGRVSR